ncbi:hypothetical protein L083_3317 [Actinoplanes sp. N902-109]|nr:hypothetical protein L083_3317 [Actinoplanes sp. N902-109]
MSPSLVRPGAASPHPGAANPARSAPPAGPPASGHGRPSRAFPGSAPAIPARSRAPARANRLTPAGGAVCWAGTSAAHDSATTGG